MCYIWLVELQEQSEPSLPKKGACQDKLNHKAKETILISEERFIFYDVLINQLKFTETKV